MFMPSNDLSLYEGNSVNEASIHGISYIFHSFAKTLRMALSTDIFSLKRDSYFAPAEWPSSVETSQGAKV